MQAKEIDSNVSKLVQEPAIKHFVDAVMVSCFHSRSFNEVTV